MLAFAASLRPASCDPRKPTNGFGESVRDCRDPVEERRSQDVVIANDARRSQSGDRIGGTTWTCPCADASHRPEAKKRRASTTARSGNGVSAA